MKLKPIIRLTKAALFLSFFSWGCTGPTEVDPDISHQLSSEEYDMVEIDESNLNLISIVKNYSKLGECNESSYGIVKFAARQKSYFRCARSRWKRANKFHYKWINTRIKAAVLAETVTLGLDSTECPARGGRRILIGFDFDKNGKFNTTNEVILDETFCDAIDGKDGEKGDKGDSCTLVDNDDGTKTIFCEDGSVATVSDGQDGTEGQDGLNSLTKYEQCTGGFIVHTGLDDNRDHTLQMTEIDETLILGCDADSDGVADDVDLCPNEGDLGNGIDQNGCPKPLEKDSCNEDTWQSFAPNLQNCSLANAYLLDANLSGNTGMILTDANLSGAYLWGANLRSTNLGGANLSRAILVEANLSSAILLDADLTRAYLLDADLTGANLRGSDLRNATLSRAILSSGTLTGANLIDANLNRAKLIDANLIDADLRNTNLKGTDLSGSELIDAKLSGANLQDAILTGANMLDASLRGADLSYANLQDATMTRADLINATLLYAKLINAKLINANLSDADLTGADLSGADLSDAILNYAKLINAKFINAKLINTTMRYANLNSADLSGADLSGADLRNADLTGADLSGADLTGAIGGDLTGAIVSPTTQLP